jgi:site-specific DNA-methyltransferase (adenine-specific)
MDNFQNKIILGDCIKVVANVKPFADLIFADPPFNIGYQYDHYKDKVKKDKYIAWTKDWMTVCNEILKPDELKLTMRNWIIWHYTFGQQTKNKFARAHTHIFYFVKDKKNFTFNDYAVRFASDRQLIYNDKRANLKGKMPDDVWSHYARVCGTFGERKRWHPCQMPELLLSRIIKVSSNQGDWVLDPFSGSGTTAVVAAKLGRIYTGIELSGEYVRQSRKRIKESKDLPIEGEGEKNWTEDMDRELKWLYHENDLPTGQLAVDQEKLNVFAAKFNSLMGYKEYLFNPSEVMHRLIRLRKNGQLGPLGKSKRRR